MKRTYFASLLALVALNSCDTMHDAEVAGFRVVDAPHVYIRRQLGMDENGATTTTTTQTTETTYATDQPGAPGPQPYNAQPGPGQVNPPPPPTQTSRRITAQQQEPEPPADNQPPPPKKIAQKEQTSSANQPGPKPSASPRIASGQKSSGDFPYAKPVPGKPGYVFSPFDKNGGYVDVTGYSPGQKVKDPYTGKIFLVP